MCVCVWGGGGVGGGGGRSKEYYPQTDLKLSFGTTKINGGLCV